MSLSEYLAPYLELYNERLSLGFEDTVFLKYPQMSNILPFVAVGLYILMVFGLPKILPQKGFNIKWIMFFWNIFLSVFSLAMFLGILIPYIQYMFQAVVLERRGISAAVCGDELALVSNPMKFWAYCFCWSKYLELIDTFLMILKKPSRRPIFLHWYHHATVLLFTWFASFYQVTVGWPFIVMNTLIHTFMYYYYAVVEIGYRPKWGKLLTMGQTTQMVLGLMFNGIWAYKLLNGTCYCWKYHLCKTILVACAIMYSSYFILFTKLFIDKYVRSQKPSTTPVAQRKSKKVD